MATQFASLTPTVQFPRFSPSADIKIARLAGLSQQAAISTVPAEDARKTLDLLALKDRVEALIQMARGSLSAAMLPAFLNWGETTARFCTRWASDEEGNELCEATAQSVREIASIRPTTIGDLMFKIYLLGVEQADAMNFGPFERDYRPEDTYTVHYLVDGMAADLPLFSPLVVQLNEIASLAKSASKRNMNWPNSVGRTIAEAFKSAAEAQANANSPSDFQSALAEYRRLKAISDAIPVGGDGEDAAVDAYCTAMDRVLGMPAQNAGDLTAKIELAAERFSEIGAFPELRSILLEATAFVRVDRPVADPHADWLTQLAEYRRLRAISDANPRDDDALDAYCEQLDRVLQTPAPDASALAIKASLVTERLEDIVQAEPRLRRVLVETQQLLRSEQAA